MMLKNEIFACVLDWLIKNKYVDGQKDLAQKTGITQTTISRIMTGKVEPTDTTLRKLNSAFGDIFNMQYLRGHSTTMLMKDAIYYEQHPQDDHLHHSDIVAESEEIPYSPIPKWADSLIQIMSEQIKQNEALNQQLRQSINDVQLLHKHLQNLLQKLPQNQ